MNNNTDLALLKLEKRVEILEKELEEVRADRDVLLAAAKLALKIMYVNPIANIDMITGCSTTLKTAIFQVKGKKQ